MSHLIACIFVTLVSMWFIPATPADPVAFGKMLAAIVFIVLVWVLFAVGGHPVSL
jgi:hypothetical protein